MYFNTEFFSSSLRTLAEKKKNFNAAFTFDNTTWNWTFH